MSTTLPEGPFCGVLGCRSSADVVINHPEHGKRTVCNGCGDGHEVICDV